jgi:hypothetical protein
MLNYAKGSEMEGFAMGHVPLNRFIKDFEELPLEDKEYAVELIQKQLIEAKRDRLSRRAKEAVANLSKGKVKQGSVEDLLKDLESE